MKSKELLVYFSICHQQLQSSQEKSHNHRKPTNISIFLLSPSSRDRTREATGKKWYNFQKPSYMSIWHTKMTACFSRNEKHFISCLNMYLSDGQQQLGTCRWSPRVQNIHVQASACLFFRKTKAIQCPMSEKNKMFPSSTLFSLDSLNNKSHSVLGSHFKSHKNNGPFWCQVPKALWRQGHSHFLRCSIFPD